MKAIVFFLCVTICAGSVKAGEVKFPVSDIPEDMKENMYAVIRERATDFKILDREKSVLREYMAITILNPKGKAYAKEHIFYDKMRKITSLKATVYDPAGNVIRKLKSSEVVDQSAVSGYSLYEDDRVKLIDLTQAMYPYTVEIEYEVEMKFLFFIPGFYLYHDDEVTTQKATYSVSYQPHLKPRFKTFKMPEPTVTTTKEGLESLTWSFTNIKPSKFEKWSPGMQEIVPNIKAAPTQFGYGGYAGNMDTWEAFGKWLLQLNEGRNVLPEETKAKVRELTKGLTTPEEKIKVLYDYLQSKTRYVSIQLGIGGWQPFEAKVVDQLGYGDCKALSNYMVALLKEAGITGYYTVIYGGENFPPVSPDFAINQFNHIIVTVPTERDTIWLECTSQTNPFGYIGTFTGDRYALMITEQGGKLIKTRSYGTHLNVQSRTADVFVEASGSAKAKVRTTYKGLQYENDGLHAVMGDRYDDQKKWVLKSTSIPNFDLSAFSFTNHKETIPSAVVDLDLVLPRLASVSGKRLFLSPNLMNKSTFIPEKVERRNTDIVRKYGHVDYDTIHYHLPETIYPEFLPEPVSIQSPFGEYEATYTVEQGKVVYIRKMKVNSGRFKPEMYQEFSDFYRSVNKADNTKLVFLNKT